MHICYYADLSKSYNSHKIQASMMITNCLLENIQIYYYVFCWIFVRIIEITEVNWQKIQKYMKQSLVITGFIALAVVLLTVPYLMTPSQDNLTKDPPQTVPHVELQRYAGEWHQIASIPAFERGCSKTTATYTLNSDESIKVNNTCIKNGAVSTTIGKATKDPIDTENTNSKLIVRLPVAFNLPGSYWIVRLDSKDYTYSVVSTKDYKYLWLLYRQPVMPAAVFQAIYSDLQKDGFQVQKLVKTPQ